MAGHMLEELDKVVRQGVSREEYISTLEGVVFWHEEFARDLYQALLGNPPTWMNGFDLDNLAAEYPWLREDAE